MPKEVFNKLWKFQRQREDWLFSYIHKYYSFMPHFKMNSILLCSSQKWKKNTGKPEWLSKHSQSLQTPSSVSPPCVKACSLYQSHFCGAADFFFSGYDALGILIIHVFFSLLLYRNKVLSKSFSTSVSAKRSSYSCKMLLLSDNRTELMRSISSYQHPRGTVNNFCRHLH